MGQIQMERANAGTDTTAELLGEIDSMAAEVVQLKEDLKRARFAASIWQRMAAELAYRLDELEEFRHEVGDAGAGESGGDVERRRD